MLNVVLYFESFIKKNIYMHALIHSNTHVYTQRHRKYAVYFLVGKLCCRKDTDEILSNFSDKVNFPILQFVFTFGLCRSRTVIATDMDLSITLAFRLPTFSPMP